MTRLFLTFCIVVGLQTTTVSETYASFADIPLDSIVSNSPVVIVGEIKSVESAEASEKKDGYRYDTAFITVAKVLKNSLPDFKISIGDKIPLSMPSSLNTVSSSLEIQYKVGAKGVWILERKDSTFWATYPKDFRPMSKENEVRTILQRLQGRPSDKPPASVTEPESHCYASLPPLEVGASPIQLMVHVFRPSPVDLLPTGSAVVVFHGGGWSVGSAEWAFGAARRFAHKGIVGIAVQYRLSDRKHVTPLDAMADTREAIRWVRENADSLEIAADRIIAYGWSAGAHLALSAAIFEDPSGSRKTSCVPDALILKSPAVDLVNDSWFCKLIGDSLDAGDYSPVEHVRGGLPPTIILQGRTDTVTPITGVQRFHDEMIAAQNRCELRVFEGVGHLFTPAGEPDDGYPNPDPHVQAAAWSRIDKFLASLGLMVEKE